MTFWGGVLGLLPVTQNVPHKPEKPRKGPRTKNQPKEEVLGADILRTSAGAIRADIPAQNFGQGGQNPGKTQAFRRGHPHDPKRGRPRPKGISKNFGQKNFGLNFCSLKEGQGRGRERLMD